MSLSSSRNPLSPGLRRVSSGGGWFPSFTGARTIMRGAAWLATLAFMAGCSFKTPQSTLDPHGLVSREQLSLFYVTVWVSLFIFVTLGTTMAVVVWKYREKPEDADKPMPTQSHGNPVVEIGLITASIALLVIIAIPTLKAIWLTDALPINQPYWKTSLLGDWYAKVGTVPATAEKEPLEITVYGYQWWWGFDYKQFGVVTANEMVFPKDRVVKFNLRSDNVIHSFWLPKIAGKVDLIPGRANWMWMMADKDADTYEYGLYYGQCAQYCGESHAYMLFRARVVSDEDFAKWIAAAKKPVLPPGFQPPAETSGPKKDPMEVAKLAWVNFVQTALKDPSRLTTPEQKGAALFFGRAQCILCHTITGSPAQGKLGPNLSRVATRTAIAAGFLDNLNLDGSGKIDPARQLQNFYHWISHPYDVKPGNLMWYPKNASSASLRAIVETNEKNHTPITDEDWHHLAAYLQTLN